MIRAIILCCDEQNRRMSLKEELRVADAGCNTVAELPGYQQAQDPSPGRSYGDGLNCGYMQERFSYSSGQSPSYTNYRMGWSTGYIHCQPANPRYHEGIISTPTPAPVKWRSRSASTGGVSGGREPGSYDDRDCQLLGDPQFPGGVELLEPGDISDESLSKWPPTGEKKNSLRKGMYTSFNKDIFQERSDLGEELWSSMEYPPSPKDAFRETCEFYGDPAFTKRRHPRRYEMQMNGFVNGGGSVKLQRAKPKKLEFYKSDSKLSNHVGAESSSEEMENFINPISRSKSLHDLEHCKPQPRPAAGEAGEQVGLSEHDLNRARSVLGLPVSGPGARGEQDTDLGYDSQPASTRNSINFADLLAGVAGAKKEARSSSRSGHARDRGLGYRLRDTGQLQAGSATARVSFPSPCITSTRQLTDQSSTSHPSSPPSPSPAPAPGTDPALALLKQYYLDCILKIDPNHPVGQTFPKEGASGAVRPRERPHRHTLGSSSAQAQAQVKNPEFRRMYSASRAENLRLRSEINNLRSDLEAANRHLDIAFQESAKNSGSDTEKREKKVMEKKLANIREQIKGLTISGNLTCQNQAQCEETSNLDISGTKYLEPISRVTRKAVNL